MASGAFLLFVLLFVAGCFAACPSITTYTNWSANTAWSKANATVTIPAGQTVYLDAAPAVVLGVISVRGTLYFSNNNMELQTQGIVVYSGGALVVGTPACPITAQVTITLYGRRGAPNTLGTDPYVNSTYGTVGFGQKGIAVATGGSIQMNGYTSGPLWTTLSSTVQSGGKVITLKDPVNWVAKDTIVIASTDYSEVLDAKNKNYTTMNGIPFPEQSETAVIATVSNDKKTITLVSPLTYMHWGADYERAEVGLLNRKIIVRGDNTSDAELYGGHVMLRSGPVLQISGVEFTRMGQQGVLGRYPVHFHVAMDVSGVNASVTGCSIHNNYQRCLSVHETSGVLVQNNVAYLTYGHCYFLEDGSEQNNIFDNNLGIYTKPMFPPLIPSDNQPSVFWISNPQNTFTNNAASSTFVGFWVLPPAKPVGEQGEAIWANVTDMLPRKRDFVLFDNNVAHSCYRDGFQAELGQDQNQVLVDNTYWAGNGGPNAITRFIGYKCRRSAVWTKFVPYGSHDNCVFLDGAENLLFSTGGVTNTIFVAETDNIGLVTDPAYGRSNWNPNGLFSWSSGYRTYDNGGTSILANLTFVNFTVKPSRPMGALAPSNTGQFGTYPDNICWNCKFINALPMISPTNVTLSSYKTVKNGLCYPDASGGYIPGGGWLNGNQTLWGTLPGAQALPQVNGYLVPTFHGRFAAMHVFPNPYGQTSTNPIATDTAIYGETTGVATSAHYRPLGSSPTSPDIMSVGKNPTPTLGYWSALLTDNNGRRLASGPYLDIALLDHRRGDWNVLAIPLPRGTNYNVTYGTIALTKAKSWEELSAYQTWYDSTTQHLYVLMNIDPYGFWSFPYGGLGQSYNNWIVGSQFYQIRSDCGASCAVGSTYVVPPMPSTIPYVLRYDRYIAQLQGVSVKQSQAQIYVQLYPANALGYPAISYQIWHGLTGNANTLYTAFEDSVTGAKLADNVNGQSAFFSIMLISRDFWQAMVNGTVKVSIRSVSDNSYILSGVFRLQETAGCYRPPAPLPKCGALSYSSLSIDSGAFKSSDYSISNPVKVNFTGPCGGAALGFNGNSYLYLNQSSSGKFMTIPAQYTYMEFYAKIAQPNQYNWNFFNLSLVAQIPGSLNKTVLSQNNYVDYILNSNGWSFVRVKLSDIGGQKISFFTFLGLQNSILWMDQLRFTNNASPMPSMVVNRSTCTQSVKAVAPEDGTSTTTQNIESPADLVNGAATVVPIVLLFVIALMV